MQLKAWWKALIGLMLSLLWVQSLLAGTTGKISGYVTDKSTGEPLVGANVSIVGTTMGAAADQNGSYTILYVPPGKYTVQASVIGYTRLSYSDVRVQIDLTRRLDFALEMETLAGEEVVVVAEKRVVQEDVATSVVSLSNEELAVLPFSAVEDVVGLQAGVENGLEIRGGGLDEALFQVDGITLRDPRNNKPITGLALSAIQELSMERGGFNAEYGQVRSGIINIVTKEGSKHNYHGSITMKYGPPAEKHFGISPFDPNSMWCRPYLDDAVCWTGTEHGTWDYYTQRQYPQFDGWNAISERLMTDDDPTNDLTPDAAQRVWQWEHRRRPRTDQPDYNIDAGLGGPVPFLSEYLGNLRFFSSFRREREMLLIPLSRDDYLEDNWMLKLVSDINESMKLRLTGLTGKSYNVAINATDFNYNGPDFGINGTRFWLPTDFVRTPFQVAKITSEQRPGRIFCDSWYSQAEVAYKSLAAKLTHTLNPKTYYEASFEFVERDYTTGPIGSRDPAQRYEIVPGYFVDEAPYGWSPNPDAGISGMFFGGHTSTSRDSTRISSFRFKLDLTSQMNFFNEVKTGFEFVYSDLNFDFGLVNPFFGDINYVKQHTFPYRGALYVQDKLEVKGFIVNAGLRLDVSNANTDWIKLDPFDKSFFSSKFDPDKKYPSESAQADVSLSPRLSISHPISENSKLFFNYGHFKQLPTYEEIFRIGRGAAGGMRNFGDPNLIQAKTISYELGYDHALFDTYLIQLAAFYKDITDQQSYIGYTSADGSISYSAAANNNYEDIRGFELTLRKSMGKWWTGSLNYTYRVSTLGHFGQQQIFENPSEQRVYDQNTRYLYQERPIPQPFARANLLFRTPVDFAPTILDGKLLGDWSMNVIGQWKAGEYITWNPYRRQNIAQNVQVRDWFNVILRLNKTFKISKVEIACFIEVDNLLNTKRLSGAGFYDVNDFEDYMRSLHLPDSQDYDNIVGEDRIGDYRKDGVTFQPIEPVGAVSEMLAEDINPRVIYYDRGSGKYMNYINDTWSEVGKSRLDKILDEKAYLDMPNQTSFNFLNPRQIFFGIRTSFDLN